MTDTELREVWIEALESGDWIQAKGRLAWPNWENGQTGYCCLGVISEIAAERGMVKKQVTTDYGVLYGKEDSTGSLPPELRDLLGMDYAGQFYENGVENSLVNMNDDQGKTFAEIADVLRRGFDENDLSIRFKGRFE